MNNATRPRPLLSFWIGLVLSLPVLVAIVRSIYSMIKTLSSDAGLGGIPIMMVLPVLVVVAGLILLFLFQLYRRQMAAFVISMCYIPFGVIALMSVIIPNTGQPNPLGYGAASSFAITVSIFAFVAILAGAEYLTLKDLRATRSPQ